MVLHVETPLASLILVCFSFHLMSSFCLLSFLSHTELLPQGNDCHFACRLISLFILNSALTLLAHKYKKGEDMLPVFFLSFSAVSRKHPKGDSNTESGPYFQSVALVAHWSSQGPS